MTNIQKFKGSREVFVDLSEATVTAVFKLADGSGAALGALTNDTVGTTPEDGYLVINIAGTTYKVPFWKDDV